MAIVRLADAPRVLASRTSRRISRPSVVGDPVVLVDVELRQGADVDPELVFVRQGGRHPGIQAVDPLDDKHVIRPQPGRFPGVFLMPRLEVKGGQDDLLSPARSRFICR